MPPKKIKPTKPSADQGSSSAESSGVMLDDAESRVPDTESVAADTAVETSHVDAHIVIEAEAGDFDNDHASLSIPQARVSVNAADKSTIARVQRRRSSSHDPRGHNNRASKEKEEMTIVSKANPKITFNKHNILRFLEECEIWLDTFEISSSFVRAWFVWSLLDDDVKEVIPSDP